MKLIMGKVGDKRGMEKIKSLHDNSNYFRTKLIDMGLDILGDWDSPVVVSNYRKVSGL